MPDAAELRGFHLGMNVDQVKARVPQIQLDKPDSFGVRKTSINPFFDRRFDKTSFADVRTISLDFLDNKLVGLWIGYESTFKWPKLDEFVAGMSNALGVPAAWPAWRNGRQLKCEDFSLFASIIGGGPGIHLTDKRGEEIIATRREAAAVADEAEVIGDKVHKLYYPTDCSARQKIPVLDRISFKNKDEAEDAGYKRAKDCQ